MKATRHELGVVDKPQVNESYLDKTFAHEVALADGNNTFTAVATDSLSRTGTDSRTFNLPANVSYQHDANGNMTSDGKRGLAYDDENQLIAVTVTNHWKSEFVYDGKMRRRVRKEYTWENSAWVKREEVRYIYAGNLVFQERNDLNIPIVTYTRGRELNGDLGKIGGIGGLLARTDHANIGMTHAFYHADVGGNITALINFNQALVATYLYDPFGNLLAKSGAEADYNLYRFSSKEFHLHSGLIYYGFRFYDPNLQRWLNNDPIGFQDGINLSKFVRNTPINAVDSFGLIYTIDKVEWGQKSHQISVNLSMKMWWVECQPCWREGWKKEQFVEHAEKAWSFTAKMKSWRFGNGLIPEVKFNLDITAVFVKDIPLFRIDFARDNIVSILSDPTQIGGVFPGGFVTERQFLFLIPNLYPQRLDRALNVFAHEVGHLLMHPDKYDKLNNNQPHPGWPPNNLMVNPRFLRLTEQNTLELFKNNADLNERVQRVRFAAEKAFEK